MFTSTPGAMHDSHFDFLLPLCSYSKMCIRSDSEPNLSPHHIDSVQVLFVDVTHTDHSDKLLLLQS